jgi:hypothetical protein
MDVEVGGGVLVGSTGVGVAGGFVAVGNIIGVGVIAGVAVKVGLGVFVGGTGVACGPSCAQPVAASSRMARVARRTVFRRIGSVPRILGIRYWVLTPALVTIISHEADCPKARRGR